MPNQQNQKPDIIEWSPTFHTTMTPNTDVGAHGHLKLSSAAESGSPWYSTKLPKFQLIKAANYNKFINAEVVRNSSDSILQKAQHALLPVNS